MDLTTSRATIEAMPAQSPPPSPAPPVPPVPPGRATVARDWRLPDLDTEQAVIGGVAAGVARELAVPVSWLRLSFIALFAVNGWGALLYTAMWAGLRWLHDADLAPARSTPVPVRGRSHQQRLLAIVLITTGLAMFGAFVSPFRDGIGYPLGFVLIGLGLAWRTSSADRSEMPGRRRIRELLGGVCLVVGGLTWLLFRFDSTDTSSFLIGAAAIAVIGTVVVSGPWIYRVLTDFDLERQARIRSEERAEVAAHIHDSVLQTLALIQKAEDRQTAVNLARRQERELRNWLDPNRASRLGGSIRGQLDRIATDVEALHGVAVEVVTVGDALVDEGIDALLGAAQEAAVNAAKHSGAARVDLFVEVSDDAVELFVRDTGSGFDRAEVAPDRRGLSESIIGRMERAGGTATIWTEAGEGTEVELRIERNSAAAVEAST